MVKLLIYEETWFNTAAFSVPAPFTYGNASRTIPNIMGPRLINEDFALYKDFVIREKYKIDLRGEAFNLMNRGEDLDVQRRRGSTFGDVSSIQLPRTTRVGIRYNW